ncbi:MAG TPA: carboxypeptidase-like regulatory domain-containing protein [Acidobacteriota bacterium]|nr:carboxypeptidase-like regulatory domain-containing protein [Acidobacteriota bacterium]
MKKPILVLAAWFVWCGSLLLFVGDVTAQTVTGTIAGQVIDQQQIPLAGVLVRFINLENGFDYGKRTDRLGTYRIEFLPAGAYQIVAEKDGFRPTVIAQFLVEVNRQKIIKPPPIQLIPLNSSPPATSPDQDKSRLAQVNVTDAALRGSFPAGFLNALPLAGIRNFDRLAFLFPGIAPPPATTGANGPGIGPGVGTAGQFSVNGQRARSNNFTVNGSDNNDQEVGVRRQGFTPAIPIPVEGITEFQVTTLLADSEAGRNTGGQINVLSRSGSSAIHGEFHDFLTGSALKARDFFDLSGPGNPAKNAAIQNQIGASLGFPIVANRWHILTAFEHQLSVRDQESHFAVPTLTERNTALQSARQRSRLGVDVLDPTFYPLPNDPGGPYGGNTLTKILSADGNGLVVNLGLDGQTAVWGRPTTVSLRAHFTDDDTRIPVVDDAINSSVTALTRTHNLALVASTELSSRLANQFRFSFGRTALRFAEVADSPFIFQSRLTNRDRTGDGIPDGRTGPIGRLLLSPYSPLGVDPGTFPQRRVNNTFQVAETLVREFSRVTLKAGADVRRVQINSALDRNYRAQVAFTPGFLVTRDGLQTGSGADFAAFGLPSDIFQALAVTPDSSLAVRFTELNLFTSAQVRLSPNFTVELGLRYERNTVPTDATGRLERSLTVQNSELPPFDPESAFAQIFLGALDAQRSFLGGRRNIIRGDGDNVAVRAGFAWDLSKTGRMSLRGGYGLFYDPILGTVVSQSRNALPSFIPVNFGSSVLFPNALSANPAFLRFGAQLDQSLIVPGTVNTISFAPEDYVSGIGRLLTIGGFFVGSGFGAAITLPDQNLASPTVHQYSLSLERTLPNGFTASLAYVGTTGRNLLRVRTPNGGQLTPLAIRVLAGGIPAVIRLQNRPNPDLGAVTVFESSAHSTYNGLQASLVRRFTTGLAVQVSYTWSHAIDDVSDIFDTSGASALAQDETGRVSSLKTERGNAAFDVRHRLTSAWSVPISLKKLKLGDFQLSGIVTLQTGQPFTVTSGFDTNFDGNLTDRINTTNGLLISNRGRTRLQILPGVDVFQFLPPIDSDHPSNGQVGRNTFRAAGIASLDVALTKKISLRKEHSLELRVEAFNLLNRTHFGIPVRVLNAPGFGSSVNTSLPARTIQAAVKLRF